MPNKTIFLIQCLMLILSIKALEHHSPKSIIDSELKTNYNLPTSVTKIIYGYFFDHAASSWKKIDQWSASSGRIHHMRWMGQHILGTCRFTSERVVTVDGTYCVIRNRIQKTLDSVHLGLPGTSRENYIGPSPISNTVGCFASILGNYLQIYYTDYSRHNSRKPQCTKFKYIQKLYTSSGGTLGATNECTIYRWNNDWFDFNECLYSKQPVKLLAFSPDGEYIVAATQDRQPKDPQYIEIWNPREWATRKQIALTLEKCGTLNDPIQALAVSNEGRISFATTLELITCKILTPKEIERGLWRSEGLFVTYLTVALRVCHRSACKAIQSIQFSHDGKIIVAVSSSSEHNIRVMDNSTHEAIGDLDSINDFSKDVLATIALLSNDDKELAVGYPDGTIRVFERPSSD